MSERKSPTDPQMELRRVRGVLHSLLTHPQAGEIAGRALHKVPVDHRLYIYLYDAAEQFNPFDRRKDPRWRKRCMIDAYSSAVKKSADHIERCKLAAVFYLLAEGLHNSPRLPDLTY